VSDGKQRFMSTGVLTAASVTESVPTRAIRVMDDDFSRFSTKTSRIARASVFYAQFSDNITKKQLMNYWRARFYRNLCC
jgi:hypothetical protein